MTSEDKIKLLKREAPELLNIINELKVTSREMLNFKNNLTEINIAIFPIINYAKTQKALTKEVFLL